MDHNDEGQWFIINTLTQYEKRVREAVQRQINLADPEIPVFEVQFPVEKYTEKRNGKSVPKERKLFPGYVFIRMNLYQGEDGTVLNEKVWHFINGIKGVSRIGGVMSPEEVSEWITVPGAAEEKVVQVARPQFNVGDQVEINDGPFTGFKGVVQEIDLERGFLRVEIQVFNRATPMELEFSQVDKYIE
ncbi:MAG: KOW motif-containing protein [Lentisphaeria bacterium]|nr:KOW motif-containing protein [Lentisphaeria bacterium]